MIILFLLIGIGEAILRYDTICLEMNVIYRYIQSSNKFPMLSIISFAFPLIYVSYFAQPRIPIIWQARCPLRLTPPIPCSLGERLCECAVRHVLCESPPLTSSTNYVPLEMRHAPQGAQVNSQKVEVEMDRATQKNRHWRIKCQFHMCSRSSKFKLNGHNYKKNIRFGQEMVASYLYGIKFN